ncbi:MAG: DnaB-like helicase C-terminal domain-containing protein [Hyphomicrobiales bacterium]
MNIQNGDPQNYEQDQGDTFDLAPHNIEAEQALLGAIFINNDAYYLVSDFLDSDHFFDQLHSKIYYVIAQVISEGKTATPVTVKDYLQPDEMIGEITVGQYLTRLAMNATTVLNAKDYGNVVKEAYQRRLVIKIAEELISCAVEADVDDSPKAIIDEAIAALHEASSGKNVMDLRSLHDLAEESIQKTSDIYSGAKLAGYSTGLQTLDSMIDCLVPGNLVPLFGRSGTFKTALSTQIGVSVAKQGGKVLMIQLEMKGYEVAQRVLSAETGISAQRQRQAKLTEADFEKLISGKEAVKDLPFWICTPGKMTWRQMSRLIERVKILNGLDMVIIDHQRRVASEPRMSAVETIENFFNGMMDMKQEHDLVFMPLVQLKTDDMRFEVLRPKVNNAYGGDIINNSADLIIATHNEHRLLKKNPPDRSSSKYSKWLDDCDKWEGKAEIGCLKYRNGEELPYRTFNVDGPRMLFSDIARPEFEDAPMGLF